MQAKKWTSDRIISVLLYLGGIFIFLYLIYVLRAYLVPFFAALLIAYILDPIVDFIQSKIIKNRVLASLLTLLLLLVLEIGIIALILPSIQKEYVQAKSLMQNTEVVNGLTKVIPPNIREYVQKNWEQTQLSHLFTKEYLQEYSEEFLQAIDVIVSGTIGVITSLFSLLAFGLYLIFLLISFDKLFSHWDKYIPKLYRTPATRLIRDIEREMKAYFRGQTLIVLSVSILFATGFKIIGLPLAILFGIFVGLMNYIPYLQTFGIFPALLLGFIQSLDTGQPLLWICAKVLIVFAIVQLIQDALLTPRIMENVTGLNPALILLTLSIWGGLFGIIGMIIALPMTSLMINYYRLFILRDE